MLLSFKCNILTNYVDRRKMKNIYIDDQLRSIDRITSASMTTMAKYICMLSTRDMSGNSNAKCVKMDEIINARALDILDLYKTCIQKVQVLDYIAVFTMYAYL